MRRGRAALQNLRAASCTACGSSAASGTSPGTAVCFRLEDDLLEGGTDVGVEALLSKGSIRNYLAQTAEGIFLLRYAKERIYR